LVGQFLAFLVDAGVVLAAFFSVGFIFEGQADFIVISPTWAIACELCLVLSFAAAGDVALVGDGVVDVGFVNAACFLFGEEFHLVHFVEIIPFDCYLGDLAADEFVFVGLDERGDDVAGIERIVAGGILAFLGGLFALLQERLLLDVGPKDEGAVAADVPELRLGIAVHLPLEQVVVGGDVVVSVVDDVVPDLGGVHALLGHHMHQSLVGFDVVLPY
jgi:hypothetical protein